VFTHSLPILWNWNFDHIKKVCPSSFGWLDYPQAKISMDQYTDSYFLPFIRGEILVCFTNLVLCWKLHFVVLVFESTSHSWIEVNISNIEQQDFTLNMCSIYPFKLASVWKLTIYFFSYSLISVSIFVQSLHDLYHRIWVCHCSL
jgi:hypothetical protein